MSPSQARGLRWAIAIVAMSLLAWYVGPARLAATLAQMDLRYVLAYTAAFLAVPFLYGLQIYGALHIAGYAPSLGHAVAATANSWSVGTLTPARAGDLTLAFFLGYAVKSQDAHALVVVDKVVSLVVLAGIALLSAPLLPDTVARAVLLGAGLVLAAAVLGLLLLASSRSDSPLPLGVRRLVGATADESLTALRRFARSPRLLGWSTAMAAIRWAYIGVINLLIFRAVDAAPSLATVLSATSVGRIISIVPVSIGGLGVKEPAQIIIYGSEGIGAESVMAVSIVGLACGFLVAAIAPLLSRSFARAPLRGMTP